MRLPKSILFPCLLLSMWVGLTYAGGKEGAKPVQEGAKPVIEVKESTFDFQQVNEGDVVKHDFQVFNRGDAVLEIKKVKPG